MTEPQTNFDSVALLDAGEQGSFVQGMGANQAAFAYAIKGRPMFAFADIYLAPDQEIIADSGSLLWLSGDVDVSTSCVGGPCVSYLRSCSGEPFCFNTYRGTAAGQKVAIGTRLPGDVMALGVTPGNGWALTFDAFIAGTSNLVISTRWSGCCTCCIADESAFITKVTCREGEMGVVLVGGYGMIERHDIPEGETLLVSRGLFFAAQQNVGFEVGLNGGCTNLCCTGGGIVMKFHGPAAIYTSSKNPTQLLRDFGIPGGKEANLKYVSACYCCMSLTKEAASGAGSSAGGEAGAAAAGLG